jgi:hypothetical protein
MTAFNLSLIGDESKQVVNVARRGSTQRSFIKLDDS